MPLTRIEAENFTVFEDITIQFSKGLNVLVGENGMGKTHIMKLAYAACQASKHDVSFSQKTTMLFRPDQSSIGRLVNRNKNGNNTATAIPAYTTYTKTISLEGGCVNPHTSIAIGDSCCCPCNIGSQPKNVPCAYVQAIANPLIEKVGKYLTAPGSTTFEYHADVVIGLFTIIELYRITSMTVASSGPIEVPQCQPSVINDPCVGFNQLLFPYDDFDPPYRKC